MKTALIGGGRGCKAVLDLLIQGRLGIIDMEIIAVVDKNPKAPGFLLAAEHEWTTLTSIEEALVLPDLELVIELTGSDKVLDRIYNHLPPGVRVMDHVMASVFWDLEVLATTQKEQLREKEKLKAQVAADHEELRKIIDTIPDMVIVLDRDMKINRLNKSFEQMTNLSRMGAEQLFYRQAFSLTKSSDSPVDFVGPYYSVIETQKPSTVVQIKEDQYGRERCFQVTANPILDESGEVSLVVQTAQEMTELVNLKREQEKLNRHFNQIVNAVHGIITIKDLEGRYQLVNPRAERLFGLEQEEMKGKRSSDLFDEKTADIIEENDRAAFDKGSHHTTEETLRFGSEQRILVSERFPLTDYRSQIVGLCCVARDITRSRRLHQELIQSERLAAVGKLAAGVAHELNNPLTGILTFAEDLYLEASEDDPFRKDYEVIMNETMRCRRIVRDLLDYSRQKAPERQRIQISQIARRVVTMVERQASFHNIKFQLDFDQNTPEVDIDPGQIQQAILNLVINARDAMSSCGEISIRSKKEENDGMVLLEVADQGCGISEDQLDDIFEPFYSTKGDRGNGLGLPAVLSLAEQHGGRVEVESQVGRGSTFRIILPTARNEAPGEQHEFQKFG